MGIGRAGRIVALTGLIVASGTACSGGARGASVAATAQAGTGGPPSAPSTPVHLTESGAVTGSTPSSAAGTSASTAPAIVAPTVSGRAGVLLPAADDPAAAWQRAHRSPLAVALGHVGLEPTIVNVSDASAAAAAATSMIAGGVKVMIVGGLDPAIAAAATVPAHAAGVRVVAYRALAPAADAYVGVDDVAGGRLQADGLVKCLQDKGVARPRIIVLGGPAGDPSAAATKRGYDAVLQQRLAGGDVVLIDEQAAPSVDTSVELFRTMLTAAGAKVDGVLAADDALANAAIGVLRQNGLAVPVTGRGGGLGALRNLVAGTQCMTLREVPATEATLAATAAALLVDGQVVPAATVVQGAAGPDVPALLVPPVAVVRSGVKDLIVAGEVTAAELCADLVDRCAAAGIRSTG